MNCLSMSVGASEMRGCAYHHAAMLTHTVTKIVRITMSVIQSIMTVNLKRNGN